MAHFWKNYIVTRNVFMQLEISTLSFNILQSAHFMTHLEFKRLGICRAQQQVSVSPFLP